MYFPNLLFLVQEIKWKPFFIDLSFSSLTWIVKFNINESTITSTLVLTALLLCYHSSCYGRIWVILLHGEWSLPRGRSVCTSLWCSICHYWIGPTCTSKDLKPGRNSYRYYTHTSINSCVTQVSSIESQTPCSCKIRNYSAAELIPGCFAIVKLYCPACSSRLKEG